VYWTVYSSHFEVEGRLLEGSWADFVGCLGPDPMALPRKDFARCFIPGVLQGGRSDENVLGLEAVVYDLDDVDPREVDRLTTALRGDAWLAYTTWSHHEALATGRARLRLALPLSRPVARAEWAAVWAGGASLIKAVAGSSHPKFPDLSCSNEARIYYFPSRPESCFSWSDWSDGSPQDPDELRRFAPAVLPAAVRPQMTSERVARADLETAARELTRSSSSSRWGRALSRLLDAGEADLALLGPDLQPLDPASPRWAELQVAEPGSRDSTVWVMARRHLAPRFPSADPAQLASLLALGAAVNGVPEPKLADMIRRGLRDVREERAGEHEALLRRERGAISYAWAAAGERDPARARRYAIEDLQAWRAMDGLDDAELARSWVIQAGASSYVRVAGTYLGPFVREEFPSVGAGLLAPATAPSPAALRVADERGRTLPLSDVVSQHGSVARRVVADLSASRPRWEPRTSTFVEAPTPPRFEAREHPEVDRWLEVLAGERAERLRKWMAAASDLTRPAAALYLRGRKGTGKSMLAHGLAQIWSPDGASRWDAVVGGSFNDGLLRCPLIFADEHLPWDHRRGSVTSVLRELIQARTHALKRKYLPDSTVRGCIRLVMAANNDSLLNFTEELSEDDVEALADRFLYMPVQAEAERYLSTQQDLLPLFAHGWIAEHALHLRQIIPVTAGRFAVAGERGELHRHLMTGSGLRAALCHWLAQWLAEPQRLATRQKLVFCARIDGELALAANAEAVHRSWEVYPVTDRKPELWKVRRALAGLSSERRRVTPPGSEGSHQRANVRFVRLDLLESWADAHDSPLAGHVERRVTEIADAEQPTGGAQVIPLQFPPLPQPVIPAGVVLRS
jgi:hypothetical protein